MKMKNKDVIMNKKVNAIIEARMGSTRLPGKTMMQIVGKPSIELLVNA